MPPAGWFGDPSDSSRLRYWDGQRWSSHTHPVEVAVSLDEFGDEILFQERTHGSAKSTVTITKNRFSAGKRSIAFSDVDAVMTDSTQLIAAGIKSGLSHQVTLSGAGVKGVGMFTQNLPLRAGREDADRQYADICALLEVHLVPQLLARLQGLIRAGGEVEIGGIHLSAQGVRTRKTSIAWNQYCGTVDEGREVKILGPSPQTVCATTFVRFANVRLLGRLCDEYAGSV